MPRSLAPCQVDLWLCHRKDAYSLDLGVLTPAERERAGRAAGPQPAEFALGRSWIRHLLSEYSDLGPEAWAFDIGPQGKPALVAQQAALQFNLSHSGEWLAAAVTSGVPVGVDIQAVESRSSLGRLARRYYSEPERDDLARLAGEDYQAHFYRLWALKEAWTKARGGALPTALGSTSFRFEAGELVSLTPEKTREDSFWLLQVDRHVLALCGLDTALSLDCRLWSGVGAGEPFEPRLLASAGVT